MRENLSSGFPINRYNQLAQLEKLKDKTLYVPLLI